MNSPSSFDGAIPSPQPGSPLADPWSGEVRKGVYAPLVDTLRLYAGWVLAWSVAALTVAAYAQIRTLPFSTDYLDAFGNLSSLILITSAAFLFLLLSSVQKLLKGKMLLGMLLLATWIVAVVFIQQNI